MDSNHLTQSPLHKALLSNRTGEHRPWEKPLTAKVANYREKPTIFINEQPVYPMFYALTDVPGGRWAWEEIPQRNIQIFADSGIHLFQVDLFLEHCWLAEDVFDLSLARRQLQGVLEVCPEAAIMIRFHVNAPKWWIQEHPEECTQYADVPAVPDTAWGLLRIIQDDVRAATRTSLASALWKEVATEKLSLFCDQLARTPEGASAISLQLAGGVYGEWHYWGFLHHDPDVSRPMWQYFQNWLRQKYGSEPRLQSAWNEPGLLFDYVAIPTLNERNQTQAGVFRDPERERKVMDYYQCQHALVADLIIHFCGVAKASWPRPLITGAFYGYFFSVFGRDAAGGHLELSRVLDSEALDFLCGPNVYYPEVSATGDPYRSRGLITSCRLHGKLWLDEMDQRPDLNAGDQNIANIRRNVIYTFTKGMGLWFYDFGPGGEMSTPGPKNGWWDRPELIDEIKQLKKVLTDYWAQPYRSEADVLLVYDTQVYYYLGTSPQTDPVSDQVVNWTSLAAFRSGAVFDAVHLDDLERVDWRNYQVIIFANTFLLNEKQKAFIKNVVALEGRHLVWIYAPGYTDGQRLTPAFATEITGMNLYPIQSAGIPEIEFEPVTGLQQRLRLGTTPVAPRLAVKDAAVTVLGHFTDVNAVAFASKRNAPYTSWFISLPPTQPELLQYIFKTGGAHLYNTNGDIFYAGQGILALHSKSSGPRQIKLKNGKTVTVELPIGGTTILLDPVTGEIIRQ